jgi:phage-related protein
MWQIEMIRSLRNHRNIAMNWTVETLGALVDAEIAALPADLQSRLIDLLDLIEKQGLNGLPPKAVKHLEEKLWELRFTGRDGIARAIYITRSGRRVVVLRVFVKKTQGTPPEELKIARKRARSLGQRLGES